MSHTKNKHYKISQLISVGLALISVVALVMPRQTTVVHADDSDKDVVKQRVVIAPLCDTSSDEIDIQVVDEDGGWKISDKWDATDCNSTSGAWYDPNQISHTIKNVPSQIGEYGGAVLNGVAQGAKGIVKGWQDNGLVGAAQGAWNGVTSGTKNVFKQGFAIYRAPNWSHYDSEHEYLNFPGQGYQSLGGKSEHGITGTDEALANNVASKMTNSFDQITDLIESESEDDVKIKPLVLFLRDNMTEDDSVKGKVKDRKNVKVTCNPDVTMSWSTVNSSDDGADKLKQTKGVDKGTYAKNFMYVTVTNNSTGQSQSQTVQFAVPKGYSEGQYAEEAWDKKDKNAYPVPYITISGIATYAGHMAENGYYTGETTEQYIYPDQNLLSKAVGELFQGILRGLYAAIGAVDITHLIFNRGETIGPSTTGYYEGIMPYKSMETVRMFYWIFLVIAVFVLFEAIYITVIKRSMADISPAMRADFKDDLMRLIIVFILELLFVPIFGVLCRMNTFIVSMCSALVANWANLFRLGVYNFGFIFVSFITFALTITVNIQYIIRQLTIGLCYMIAPVAIATLAYDSKQNIFNVWLKALIANIFMQSFNAVVLAMLFGVANNLHSSLMRIALIYSIIPLTKWFKEDLCGLRDGAMDMANGISGQMKQDRETAKKRVGDTAKKLSNNHAANDQAEAANLQAPLGGAGKIGMANSGGGQNTSTNTSTTSDSGKGSGLRDKVHNSVANFTQKHPHATMAAIDAATVATSLAGIDTGARGSMAVGKWLGRGGMTETDYRKQQLNAEGNQRLQTMGYTGNDNFEHGWAYTDDKGKTHFTTDQTEIPAGVNAHEAYRAQIRDGMIDDQTWQKMNDQDVTKYEPGNQQLMNDIGKDGQEHKYVIADTSSPGILDVGKAAQIANQKADGFDHRVAAQKVYASTNASGGFNGAKVNQFDSNTFRAQSGSVDDVWATANAQTANATNDTTTYSAAIKDNKTGEVYGAGTAKYDQHLQDALDNNNSDFTLGTVEGTAVDYSTDSHAAVIQQGDHISEATARKASTNFDSASSRDSVNRGAEGTAYITENNTVLTESGNTNVNLYATRAAGTKGKTYTPNSRSNKTNPSFKNDGKSAPVNNTPVTD